MERDKDREMERNTEGGWRELRTGRWGDRDLEREMDMEIEREGQGDGERHREE